MKITNAFRQQTSQIFPPATPAVRKRTWWPSLPQNEQCRCPHSAVSGSGRALAADPSMACSSHAQINLSTPSVDDGFAQIESEGALADDDDRRTLHALVDGAPHPPEGVVHDRPEALGRVFVVWRASLVVRFEPRGIEGAALELADQLARARASLDELADD